MKLLEKKNQHRRDFHGLYSCEGCNAQELIKNCYDDRNFHDNVMPNTACKSCKKTTNEIGAAKEAVSTEHEDYEVV